MQDEEEVMLRLNSSPLSTGFFTGFFTKASPVFMQILFLVFDSNSSPSQWEEVHLNTAAQAPVGTFCNSLHSYPPKFMNPNMSFDIQNIYLNGGFSSQIQLTESGTGLLKPGETLELTCTVTGTSITSSYWWNWVRQASGKGLEWMGGWTASSYYAPAFSNRLTISVAPSKTKYFLRLTSVVTADSGMYYCARGTERQAKAKIVQKWEMGYIYAVR
ncbi:hypothetical protein JD844_001035 [Phrynosoma platyrhinos]|uniref:Ig-like domain-containing protein n=1 Tax=Phrynosoma platyrhinos TaxID=52577 RepID=A0ABQ7T8Z4_PHRPL|nr:hypothetical protein JD844_001035 [Phrynosoma platyrhinos]